MPEKLTPVGINRLGPRRKTMLDQSILRYFEQTNLIYANIWGFRLSNIISRRKGRTMGTTSASFIQERGPDRNVFLYRR